MAYQKIDIHQIDLDSQKELFKKYAPTSKDFDIVMNHLKLLALGEITGKPIGNRRQSKLLDMFSLFFKNLQKPINKITKEDLRTFKENLLNDKIRKENKNPYSDETKEDCTEAISRFFECVIEEKVASWKSQTGKSFRKWFVIRATKKTPDCLTEQEIETLYEASQTIEGKFVISVLFDAGCRIEEFLNIRFEDIEKPTTNFPYFRLDLKSEYSKTEGRKIGLYWKKSSESISKYLEICESRQPQEQVFKSRYDAVRMFLYRLGKKALNKKVTPHLLRKSSATHYASKLNRQQLCIRFGWKFSSDMPDVYISRAGVDEGKIKEVMLDGDINELRKDNRYLKARLDFLEKAFKEISPQIENLSIKKKI